MEATSAGTSLTATGTVSFTAGEAAGVTGGASCREAGTTVGVGFAAFLASDLSGICGYLQRSEDKASARSIQVEIVRIDPAHPTASVTAGTYPVVAGVSTDSRFAAVTVSENDAACTSTRVVGRSGKVTVTSTDGGRLQGSVDVTLADGGAVSGPFDVAPCDVTFPGDLCAGELGPQSSSCVP